MRQSLGLYASELIFLGSGFFASLIVTRFLGPERYGIYSYTLGAIAFVAIFFEFGLHTTSARLLATCENKEVQRRYIGIFALITFCLGVGMAIFLILVTYYNIGIPAQYRSALLWAAPFTIAVPFGFYFENVCQGTNQIRVLSFYNASVNVFFLTCILGLIFMHKLNFYPALGSYFLSLTISTVIILFLLKPTKPNFKKDWEIISNTNKTYGRKIFFGRVATVATYNLDKILIALFANATSVGLYSLAYAISQPLSLLSRSISFSMFRDFATNPSIPPKMLRLNFLWVTVTTTIIVIIGNLLITPLFSSAFSPAKRLLPLLAIAVAFQALYEPFNKFLTARGEGAAIQRITFKSAGLNLVVNVVLIYYYGAIGAAIASLFSMAFTYFLYQQEYQLLIGKNS